MTPLQTTFVAGAAFVAGVMNAVAGGRTLLSFPALMLVGLSPVTANATSTVALWPGQLSSAWAYRSHIQEERHRAMVLGVPAVLGGALGSALLLLLPESAFVAVVPWLILFACALLALQEPIKRAVTGRTMGNHIAVLWGIQFLISIYGGYFGAGIGILMLAAMGILIPSSMQHANALKILLALLTNSPLRRNFSSREGDTLGANGRIGRSLRWRRGSWDVRGSPCRPLASVAWG